MLQLPSAGPLDNKIFTRSINYVREIFHNVDALVLVVPVENVHREVGEWAAILAARFHFRIESGLAIQTNARLRHTRAAT